MRKKLISAFGLAWALLFLGSLGMTSASTANMLRVTPDTTEFHIYLDYAGDYETGYSTLYDDIPYDYDILYIHFEFSGSVYIEITIEDCCIMGDTMALVYSRSMYWMATSPDVITVSGSRTVTAGMTVKLYVGYVDCPGGYPAGYYWYVYTS